MNVPPAITYEGQLAERAAVLLPDLAADERLELLAVMDPDDMRSSLAFIVSMYPQVFDFALVRDEALVGRLEARLDEDQDDAGRADAMLAARGPAVSAAVYNLADHPRRPRMPQRPVIDRPCDLYQRLAAETSQALSAIRAGRNSRALHEHLTGLADAIRAMAGAELLVSAIWDAAYEKAVADYIPARRPRLVRLQPDPEGE